jgi:DNA-binding PadR family transcriptional regulator
MKTTRTRLRLLAMSEEGTMVLNAFLQAHQRNVRSRLAGADIMRAAQLSSAAVYPVIVRLEREGLIKGEPGSADPEVPGSPAGRMYRLTAAGGRVARQSVKALTRRKANAARRES